MDNTQRITLDIQDNQTYEQIYMKQGNEGYPIEFVITKNGEPCDLSGIVAVFSMEKPNGHIVVEDCILNENILSVLVTEQISAVEGKSKYEITLFDAASYREDSAEKTIITTVTGIIKVEKKAVQSDNIESSDVFNIVNDALVAREDAIIASENAKNYMNESLNSANQSAESATASANSAANSKISEDNAKISENNAESYMNNAFEYASNAADSSVLAESWAVGGTNSRVDEDINNAKYHATQSSTSATASKTSEDNAKISENNAESYMNNAFEYATTSKSYAIGTTNTRENEDIDNAKHYYEQCKTISESFSGALRPIGTVTFANLPSVTSATEGDMYNISDQFVTTADFKEGSGLTISAGSNIYKTVDGYWDVLAGSPVTGIKGANENTFRRGNVNLTAENVGAVEKSGDTTDNTVTFTSDDSETATTWTDVTTLASGEKHNSLWNKVSTMFKNIRYLYKKLGTTDISGIGDDGTVTNAITQLNSALGSKLPTSASCNRNWSYSGKDGQPDWLWGSNDGSNCYVWKPANFSVNYATSAGTATKATYNSKNIDLGRMVYSFATQTSDYHTVTNFATFVGTDNALIQGSKGNYIFGISSFSDERLKTNIKDSSLNCLDIVNKIKLHEFDFIDEKYGQHKDIGYIAQELKKIIPEAVILVPQDVEQTGYDNLYQVEDKHLIPYLVKAIQELSAKIDNIKNS